MGKGKTHRKYEFELKQRVVFDGEKNRLSTEKLSKKYGIPHTTIRDWRRAYREKGLVVLADIVKPL